MRCCALTKVSDTSFMKLRVGYTSKGGVRTKHKVLRHKNNLICDTVQTNILYQFPPKSQST